MRFQRWTAGAGLALVLAAAPMAAAASYPPPSDGQGTVTPSRIKAGECAVFAGTGFGSFVPIAVTDNDNPRGQATTDANGEFSKQLCYSSDTRPGKHVLKGTGQGSLADGGSTRTVTATLVIEGVSQSHAASEKANSVAAMSLPRADTPSSGGGDRGFTGASLLVTALVGLLLAAIGSLALVASEVRYRRQRRLA